MDFLSVCTRLLKVHTDDVILGGHGQVGIPKETIKTLRSQKQKDI